MNKNGKGIFIIKRKKPINILFPFWCWRVSPEYCPSATIELYLWPEKQNKQRKSKK